MSGRQMNGTLEERCELVERCFRNEISLKEAGEEIGVTDKTIRRWISLYESGGPSALNPIINNTRYPKELKRAAVLDYIHGPGSTLIDIAKRYGIRHTKQLREWLKVYNTHRDFKTISGGSAMSNSRITTEDERLEIVLYCLENGKNYGETAIKYHVSYQSVYQWVAKYEQLGKAGLEDRRGRRKGTLPSRTPEETLQDELARLKNENQRLQMELDIIKKFQKLERRNR